jgi:hypothetical protein
MGTPLMFNVEARNVKQSKNMKAEELKSKIQFESCDVGHNLAMITGKLEVQAVMEYDRRQIEAYRTCDRALDEIKERLREMIMRQIYADQRHELYDALVELFKADPMDYSAMSTAREKILTAAKRQRATESPLAESIAADQRTEGSSSANGSVRSYKLQCAIEWSKMDGYKNETRIEEAYSAQDAVFQASHSLRHWPHTIQSVAPTAKLTP